MIDIIIPAYNAHNTIEQTLFSICTQNMKNLVKVYICNDASDEDYSKIINDFNKLLDITELKTKKNSGPGVARQLGLDNSNGEYIVFIDSDDQFYAPDSLKKLYTKIKDDDNDIVIGTFLEERENCEVPHYNDNIWLHGKIYKREFIEKHNIKFNDTYANEDNYFNKSLLIRNPKISVINDIVYYWRFNPNSITRKNNHEYFYSGIYGYFYNMSQVLKEAIDNVQRENITPFATEFMITTYFYYLEFYDKEDINRLFEYTKDIYDIFMKYRYIDNTIEKDEFKSQFDYFRRDLTENKIVCPIITFENFLNMYKNNSI